MAWPESSKELLESYAQTPFFQEFTVTFSDESLGLEVQKVHNAPVVRRLLRQTPTWMGQAEKGGVSVGSLVSAVANLQTTSMSYDEVLRKIKTSSRPVDIVFRRLHAISDPGVCIGRLWQGFLRTWTGNDSGHWTGRFYLLCANGDLQAFVGTDPDSMSQPVDQFSVAGCPVFWGQEAREKATEHGLLLGGDWDDIFAIQPADLDKTIPLFFRTSCADSRSEWVGALATLEVSLTVALDMSKAQVEDSSSDSTLKRRSKKSIDPLAYWPPLHVLKHSLAEKGDRSVFSADVGSRPGVMGNLLASTPKWRPICLLLLPGKVNNSGSMSHPRLCWYHKAPSNANELPSGQVLLYGVKLSNLSEDQKPKAEVVKSASGEMKELGTHTTIGIAGGDTVENNGEFRLDQGALGFILHAANKVIRLRFHFVSECQDWARVLMAVSDTSDTFIPALGPSASNGYEDRLLFYQQAPESVLKGCDAVAPLLAGGADRLVESDIRKSSTSYCDGSVSTSSCKSNKYSISLSTAILRRDFIAVGGQYMLPLCDDHTSDVIFEALTEHCRQSSSSQSSQSRRKSVNLSALSPSKTQSIAIQAGKLLGDLAGSVGADKRKFDLLDNGDRLLRSIPATPLDMGISLPHKMLKQYCVALDLVTRPEESWEVLRMKIGLEESEVLIRVDEKVTCGGEERIQHGSQNITSNGTESNSDMKDPEAIVKASNNTSSSVEGTFKQEGTKTKNRTRVEWMEIGTLYVTDRNLVFLRKGRLTSYRGFETTSGSRPVARIIPLALANQVIDRGRAGLLLPDVFLLSAHLDEQVVTEEYAGVSFNFSSCRSSSMFGKSEFSLGDELKAIGGGRIRALQRIIRETIVELISAHKIMNGFSSTTDDGTSCVGGYLGSRATLKTIASRRRGVGAMIETLRTASHLGVREVWSRGCGAELTEKELWDIEVKWYALSMWTALNLKRRSALMRVTGLTLSSLLLCTRYIDYQVSNNNRWSQAHDSVDHFLKDLDLWILNKETKYMKRNDWLLYVGKWLTHRASRIQRALIPTEAANLLRGTPSFEASGKKREDAMKLRAAYSEAFNPSDFRDNWQLFMSYLDPFVDNFVDVLPGTVMHSLLHWNDPFISFGIMTAFLAIAYHDVVHLFPSICMLSYALFLLISGSSIAASASEEAMQNEIRRECTRQSMTSVDTERNGKAGIVDKHVESPKKTALITAASLPPSVANAAPTLAVADSHSSFLKIRSSSFKSSRGASIMSGMAPAQDMSDLDDEQVLAIAAAAAARSRLAHSNSVRENAADLIRDRFQAQFNTVSSALSTPASSTHIKSSDSESKSISQEWDDQSVKMETSAHSHPAVTALQSEFQQESESSGEEEEEDVEDDELKEIAENAAVVSSQPVVHQEGTDEKEGLVEFMRQMRAHLGRMQLHLHRYNKYYLRWQALHLWRDHASSWILFFVLFVGALWLAVVPHNFTFALGTIYAFARPIRKPKISKGMLSLFDAMLYQWLDGIPLEAPTHRSTSIAVQMAMMRRILKD